MLTSARSQKNGPSAWYFYVAAALVFVVALVVMVGNASRWGGDFSAFLVWLLLVAVGLVFFGLGRFVSSFRRHPPAP